MKKALFLTVCLAMASLSTFGATVSSIMLQHNGNVTMFESNEMTAAINSAVTGDTIYLSEGTFTGAFTINKAITIIGAGQKSKISGEVTISIDNNPTLTAHLFDALYLGNKLTISKAVNNLKFRKCYFSQLTINANVTDLNIDRCHIMNIIPSSYVKSGNIVNTYIDYLGSSSGNTINYINCNIYKINLSSFSATFINSIIETYNNSNYRTFYGCVLVNTRYGTGFSIDTTSSVENCYTSGAVNAYTDEKTGLQYYTISSDWLEENKYFGTDGKIIGMFGGATPYNLVPNVPIVTDSKVIVDTDNKKLNVSIKVVSN